MKENYNEWVEERLAGQDLERRPRWTESIAVGSEAFAEMTKAELGIKASGREVSQEDGVYKLRERGIPYDTDFSGENTALRPKTCTCGTYLINFQ